MEMGGRYLVTGIQLVMLRSRSSKDIRELWMRIVEDQFVFNSQSEISVDVKRLSEKVGEEQ